MTLGGAIANGTTANSLATAAATAAQLVYLGGNNTYTGATTVTGGKLLLAGSNAYAGGTTVGTNNNTATLVGRERRGLGQRPGDGEQQRHLAYAAEANAALAIGGNLTIAGTSNVTIGGSIGSTPTSAAINVAGAATVAGERSRSTSTASRAFRPAPPGPTPC